MLLCYVFFFKQKTAYEMRISDWSSDVCSSDLIQTAADPLTRVLTWHRVAVAPDADQAGAGDPRRPLDVTVEWRWHRHQFSALQLQHFGHTPPAALRVRQLVHKRAASLAPPGLALLEGEKRAEIGRATRGER